MLILYLRGKTTSWNADHPSQDHPVNQQQANMTMTMDHNSNRHLGSMGFDHLPYNSGPHFTNPFVPGGGQIYGTGMSSNNVGFDAIAKHNSRTSAPLPYASSPPTAPSVHTGYQAHSFPQPDLIGMSQDLVNHNRPQYDQAPPPSYAPTSTPYVNSYGAVAPVPQPDDGRRLSHS